MGSPWTPPQQEALRVIGKEMRSHMANSIGHESVWIAHAEAWDKRIASAHTTQLSRVMNDIRSEMTVLALNIARGVTCENSPKPAKTITGRLQDSYYQVNDLPREEPVSSGIETLPLSPELRAEVHQFYQEAMTHAKESGHLAYALDQAS